MTQKLLVSVVLIGCLYQTASAQSNPDNFGYVRKWVPHKSITEAADIISVSENNPDALSQVTTYYDDFGRPIQTVSKQASPQDKDVVSLHVYDDLGRETKKYLPFVSNTTDGDYKDNALSALNGFNQSMYPNEGNYFYSKTVYENSPLNRILSTYAPGVNWVGSSRGGSTSYLVNTTTDNAQVWNIAPAPGSLPVSAGTYPAGKLYKTITTDIKGKQTIVYKNTGGQ